MHRPEEGTCCDLIVKASDPAESGEGVSFYVRQRTKCSNLAELLHADAIVPPVTAHDQVRYLKNVISASRRL